MPHPTKTDLALRLYQLSNYTRFLGTALIGSTTHTTSDIAVSIADLRTALLDIENACYQYGNDTDEQSNTAEYMGKPNPKPNTL